MWGEQTFFPNCLINMGIVNSSWNSYFLGYAGLVPLYEEDPLSITFLLVLEPEPLISVLAGRSQENPRQVILCPPCHPSDSLVVGELSIWTKGFVRT